MTSIGISLPGWLNWLRGRSEVGLVSLLVVSLLVQLRFLTMQPIVWDLSAYSYWGDLAQNHFLNLYSFGGQTTNVWQVPEYPPLVIYLFGFVEFVYFGVAHLFGVFPGNSLTGAYLATLKLPLILAHLVVVGIIWDIAQRLTRPILAWLLVATYALSPVVLLDIHAWGQTDDFTLLLAVGALVLALKHKGVASGVVMGLMVVFKPQPLIFVPLALIYLLRWSGWRQAVLATASLIVTSFLMWLPYLLPFSSPPEVFAWLHNTHRVVSAAGCKFASCNGYNLWTLVPGNHGVNDPFLGPLSPQILGLGLFALALVAVLFKIWTTPHEGMLWAGAAVIALAFYTLDVYQYERYLFPALGLFLLAALFNRWQWPVYVTVSCVAFVNLLIIALHISNFTRLRALQVPHLTSPKVAIALGALNCAALVWSVAIIFVLPQTRRAIERRQVFHPSYGLSPSGANLALASAGASHVATTRPLASGYLADAALPFAASGAVETVDTEADALADTLRIKAIPHSTTPKLRLHPRELGRPPYVSIVIPCYNEAGNILPMYERLSAALRSVTPTYEIIFVNNGSYDNSPAIFEEIANRDSQVSILTLSRNFGSQGAYTAGFTYASGDCVVSLDGDIQDPPELIPAFIAKWLQGYDVVYGVRARRKGSLPRRIGYKLFYRLLRRFSYVDIPVDASDFGLMDRRVINVLNEMPERSRLIRGLRAFAGFNQVGIPYERQERFSGLTTNSFLGLFRWASLGLISFSFAPLDLISYLAGVVVALTAVAAVVYIALYFIVPGAPQGFLTLLIAVLFLGAVQLLCLSIIGAYLGKIFEEVKGRPRFLVNDVQNDHRNEDGA